MSENEFTGEAESNVERLADEEFDVIIVIGDDGIVEVADADPVTEAITLPLTSDQASDVRTVFAHALNAQAIFISDSGDDLGPSRLHETKVSADSTRDYLMQVGKTRVLSASEEVELAKRIEAGVLAEEQWNLLSRAKQMSRAGRELRIIADDGVRAENFMIESNLRLVVALAKRHIGLGMAFLDLIQEGNLGLIRAVKKFDHTLGYKFSTYATWWIRQAISRAMADQSRTIRIPVHMVELMNKMARVQRKLQSDLGREPTIEEIAAEAEVTPERVIEVRKLGKHPISLSSPVGRNIYDESGELIEHDGDEFGDLIIDDDHADLDDAITSEGLNRALTVVLDSLSEREAGVIRMRYGLDDGVMRTLDEIGETWGVTRERIRQIEAKTMAKLRHPQRSMIIREFLE